MLFEVFSSNCDNQNYFTSYFFLGVNAVSNLTRIEKVTSWGMAWKLPIFIRVNLIVVLKFRRFFTTLIFHYLEFPSLSASAIYQSISLTNSIF